MMFSLQLVLLISLASAHMFLHQGVQNVQPYMRESKLQLLVGQTKRKKVC